MQPAAGIVVIAEDAVMALNAVDPMITLATVPQYHRTDENGMVATTKIIAYSVTDASLAQAEVVAAQAISIATPKVSKGDFDRNACWRWAAV